MRINEARVAIVHDWLVTRRGGEKVLEAILELFPEADLFTLFGSHRALATRFHHHKLQTSYLDQFPWIGKYYRYLLPLYPLAVENLNVLPYDIVISSSHCAAKGVIPSPGALHVSYCHTPMRYAWDQFDEYFDTNPFKPIISFFMRHLRMWDVTTSHRVDHFVANSSWVAKRIEKYYRRESTIIHPFFDANEFSLQSSQREDFYLIVSALVPYKRIDIAIEACRKMNRRLKIVGEGPELASLKRLSTGSVEFLGKTDSTSLKKLYQTARALLLPGLEDFGITPLEAMASGTPVIAYGRGGATDTVVPSKTGIFFEQLTAESLADALKTFDGLSFSPEECRAVAETFSKINFQLKFKSFIDEKFNLSRENQR